MLRTTIRRALALGAALLAVPAVSWAADLATKAAGCCTGCPLGCG